MAIRPEQIRELKNDDLWVKQIIYWRTHLDVFIEEYFDVKLKDTQKVEARCFGNCDDLYFVQSRGYGKTWLTAVCCLAMGVLYPNSNIAVISGTAEQAVLVLKKIDEYFARLPNIAREIQFSGKRPVSPLTRNKGICTLKNGSRIESYSLGTFRGNRAKIIVVDEAPEVKKTDLEEVAKPVRNTTRPQCVQHGLTDYTSKMISITSACLKSNYFYELFMTTLQKMSKGDLRCFACALNYQSAVRCGISAAGFFAKEREDLPKASFDLEYGSIFLGAEQGTVFPFELTDRSRKLTAVEVSMPAKSTADYVMSVDLATSSAKTADNAVITIVKLVEQEEDAAYLKKVVYIRSFHGKRLDTLSVEVRKLLVKFPNIIKIIFDYRGLGDAFPQFLSQPWIDPDTHKEYPPLVLDTERSTIHNAIPILSPVIANMVINQQMISALTIALERETIEIPINSRHILSGKIVDDDDDDEEGEAAKRKLTKEEQAIFIEADALQIEMGNIVAKETSAGSIVYDVAKSTQHKDRYSSLAMAVRFIAGLEDERQKKYYSGAGDEAIGVYMSF